MVNIKCNLKAHIFESTDRKSTALMFSNTFYISTYENKTKFKKSNLMKQTVMNCRFNTK